MIRLLIAFLAVWSQALATANEGRATTLLHESVVLSTEGREAGEVAFSVPLNGVKDGGREGLILIAHRDVKESWPVVVGGKRLGILDQTEQPTWTVLSLSREDSPGEASTLSILAPKNSDEVKISSIVFFDGSLAALLQESSVRVRVKDERGKALPARITFLDEAGFLAPLTLHGKKEGRAVRTGVVYDSLGSAKVGLAAGAYQVHVTRGPEYERAVFELNLRPGEQAELNARLVRSVDTAGWVSCDPHTHTFTFSRHGDATTDERVVTFAGEGLEVPVATDHNILTDYRPSIKNLKLGDYMTPVIGDEVTTKEAHFNVFPLQADSRLPDFRILDWSRLLEHFREDASGRIVVLNHPHNVHNGFRPFDRQHLNPISGRVLQKLDMNVDAMELLSSSAQQTDMMLVFRDWFALLNQGHRIVGLGASDVHDVNRYIVGQGRTYVMADDRKAGDIDVNQVCQSMREGRAVISMGLFVTMTVNELGRVGDVVRARDGVRVKVRVQAPSWITCDRVELYANGGLIRSKNLMGNERQDRAADRMSSVLVEWELGDLKHDAFLVAMATGPGDLGPSWPIPYPYQPSDDSFVPRVAGATNPIWIDRDGDAVFRCAREIGEQIWEESDRSPLRVLAKLEEVDRSVAVQVADLAYLDGKPLWGTDVSSDVSAWVRGGEHRKEVWDEVLRLKKSLLEP